MNLVLADTSVWIAHFRLANPLLQSLLATDRILCHPLIVIELACGTPPARGREHLKISKHSSRPWSPLPTRYYRWSKTSDAITPGAAPRMSLCLHPRCSRPDTRLWTMDKDLSVLAARLGVVYEAESTLPPG